MYNDWRGFVTRDITANWLDNLHAWRLHLKLYQLGYFIAYTPKHTGILPHSFSRGIDYKTYPVYFCALLYSIWVRSRRLTCLVACFCYLMIAKPGSKTGPQMITKPSNKTGPHSWPNPYVKWPATCRLKAHYTALRYFCRAGSSNAIAWVKDWMSFEVKVTLTLKNELWCEIDVLLEKKYQ